MPTLYYDYFSQPSRAILMFAEAAGIEFEAKEIALSKGEHKTADYIANVHKFG